MSGRRLELSVGPSQAGKKVDTLLRRELGLSGTVIRRVKWLEDGILLDGARVYTDHRPAEGQLLSVLVSDEVSRSDIVPRPGPLDIVHEDEDLLVVCKAPGVLVHPGPGHFDNTLGNYVLNYYRKTGVQADYHPVHRLDKGTSGLMVIAKHAHAQEVLKERLHSPDFRRYYLAVCEGVPEPLSGYVDAPIARAAGSLMAREVRADGAAAKTGYEVLGEHNGKVLLRLELFTGRTHQIRVHMAFLGHPLTGDYLYGTEDKAVISRPALHSSVLAFTQPVTGERFRFESPLPDDMVRLLV